MHRRRRVQEYTEHSLRDADGRVRRARQRRSYDDHYNPAIDYVPFNYGSRRGGRDRRDFEFGAITPTRNGLSRSPSFPSVNHSTYPYGNLYPPAGYTDNVQIGLVTEHMLRRLDESRMLALSDMMRRSYGGGSADYGPFVQEPRSPRYAIEGGPRRLYYASPGNGDWKGQLDHIMANLYEVTSADRQFRHDLGEPIFGQLDSADLEESDDAYRLVLTFDKPKHMEQNGDSRFLQLKARDRPVTEAKKRDRDKIEAVQEYEREPEIKQEGTLKPVRRFNVEQDAETLRQAMKGIGTDESTIIQVMCTRSAVQRLDIVRQFKTMFGKDLVKELASELSFNLKKVIIALCMSPIEYDAKELRDAIKGLGTDDACLIEIICTRTAKSLYEIQLAYKKLFNVSLEDDILGDTSGHYGRLLVSLLQANRDERNVVDKRQAKQDAQALHTAGAAHWGTDESKFNTILVSRSFSPTCVHQHYELQTKKRGDESFMLSIQSQISKPKVSVTCIRDKAMYFAQQIYNSTKGLGTDDDMLIRVIVSRAEVDMVQIKKRFQQQYNASMAQFIAVVSDSINSTEKTHYLAQDDTSGDYRKALLTLVGEANLAT